MEPKVEVINLHAQRRVNLTPASLCVNCWPIQNPAFFVWGGHGLCESCFTPLRQELDQNKNIHIPGLNSRDYVKTWGTEPIIDAEIV